MNKLTREALTARRLPSPALARAIRNEAGVSQARLAEELGVHRVTVARWEIGSRRPRGRLRLAYVDVLEELQRNVLSS
jgi:DNA-binding transcriptional regulator YiaG